MSNYYGKRTNSSQRQTAPAANMSGLFGGGASSSANPTQGDLTKDVQVQNGPEDSISDLVFSPASDHMSVASWDNKVRIYSINQNGGSEGVAMLEHQGPALSTCWSKVSPHYIPYRE